MSKKMFDFCIGNPAYQKENLSNGRQPPIYNDFMDAAEKVSNVVEFITPGRFLFNAGQTPKKWNEKKLSDPHFKVLLYEHDSKKIFPSNDIKGGIAITIRNSFINYGAVGEFIENKILRNIVDKIKYADSLSLNSIHFNRSSYRLTEDVYNENPNLLLNIKQSEKYAITSNIFDKFPELFSNNNNSSDFIKVYGRSKNSSQRIYKEIKKEYIADHANKEYWKVFVAKSNGTGKYGEALSPAEVASPGTVGTQTFISFGKFKSKEEAISLKKYLSTKFLRSLLGIKKVTPDNARKDVWLFVPLQDFTDHSDIDWSKSIPEIDQQLYRKYGLNDEEIDFIETHVKEMK